MASKSSGVTPTLSHVGGYRGKPRGRNKVDNSGVKSKQTFRDRLELLMREHKPPMLNRKGKLSATQLERVTGINKTTLQNYIQRNIPDIPAHMVFRIADAFSVSVNWLWRNEGPKGQNLALDAELNRLLHNYSEIKSAKSRALVLELAEICLANEHRGNKNT